MILGLKSLLLKADSHLFRCIYLCCIYFVCHNLSGQDIYLIDTIQRIDIVIDQDGWQRTLNEIKLDDSEKTISALLAINGVSFQEIGIRYKGNSSFYYRNKKEDKKLPFHLDINNKEARKSLSVKNILLNNIFRDPSFVREILAYEIIRDYMPAPRINYAKLTINRQYLGLYHNVEFIDDKFLNDHFGESSGVLFKCDPNYKRTKTKSCPYDPLADLIHRGGDSLCYYSSYEKKSKHGWKELTELTDILNNQTKDIERILNVDQVLFFIALNNIMVNLDSYTGNLCHNYYLYQDSSGIFNPIIWDLNLAFGGFDLIGKRTLNKEQLVHLSPFLYDKNEQYPLISKLLSIKKYRLRYIDIYNKILKEQFVSGNYIETVNRLQNIIKILVEKEINNSIWPYNIYNSAQADGKSIIGIEELMQARIEYLVDYFER